MSTKNKRARGSFYNARKRKGCPHTVTVEVTPEPREQCKSCGSFGSRIWRCVECGEEVE